MTVSDDIWPKIHHTYKSMLYNLDLTRSNNEEPTFSKIRIQTTYTYYKE